MEKLDFEYNYDYSDLVSNQRVVLDASTFDDNDSSVCDLVCNSYNLPTNQLYSHLDYTRYNEYKPSRTLASKDFNRLVGGAPNNKKKPMKERSEKDNILVKTSDSEMSPVSIKELGTLVLDEIMRKYPFIVNHNNFDGQVIISTVKDILSKKQKSVTTSQFEHLMNYIQSNFVSSLKTQIIQTHPLFSILGKQQQRESLLALVKRHQNEDVKYSQTNVALSKAISLDWNDITDMEIYTNRVEFDFKDGHSELIDPIFWLLFATKFPGFEDLCILQDYMKLLESASRNELDKDNNMLFILRSADSSMLPVTNPVYRSPLTNEALRLSISLYLRELSILIRNGTFKSKLSGHLLDLLKEIKIPNKKSTEENLISAILSVFSFKPTLIAKTKGSVLRSKDSVFDPAQYYGMKLDEKIFAVHTIEYPLLDFYSVLRNEIPVFSTSNFQAIVYNTTSNKATFIRRDPDDSVDKEKMVTNLVNLVLNKNTEINTADVASTLIQQNGIEAMSKNQFPTTVLLTNGMYIVSVPREDTTYSSEFRQPSFYSNNNRFKATLNLSPVIYDEETELKKTYYLAGAICYDVIDNETYSNSYNTNNPVYHVDIEQKIGRYAILKSGNRWFEYNPYAFITNARIKERLDIIEENYYKRYLADNPNDDISKEDFIKSAGWVKQKNEILQKKMNITDMEIPEERAKSKISTSACLLFYKEDYSVYRSRADQSLF